MRTVFFGAKLQTAWVFHLDSFFIFARIRESLIAPIGFNIFMVRAQIKLTNFNSDNAFIRFKLMYLHIILLEKKSQFEIDDPILWNWRHYSECSTLIFIEERIKNKQSNSFMKKYILEQISVSTIFNSNHFSRKKSSAFTQMYGNSYSIEWNMNMKQKDTSSLELSKYYFVIVSMEN